ncbi:hypothetical protein ACQCLI_18085 [Pseudomonas nitroreducens]|uniref:hypothetical protein n=1 Tax=Pseudomonas nitroreducens TaxID=46680 RepID=UPI00037AEC9B|nr:hypothetical protein [Pseudomonas nitroreducens]
MSWLGDVGSFELFNLKGMGNQIKDNPARLLYGSADPFSTKMWNGVLGTDDKPLVDQWGGAAPQRYGEAEDAGINTGPGKTMHGVARTIAGMFAGGYGAGQAGGLLSGGQGAAAASPGAAGYGVGQPVVSGGVGNATYAGGQSPGLLSTMGSKLSSFNTAAKPYMEAAQYGQQAAGLLSTQSQEPLAAQPQQQVTGGPESLAQLAQGSQNNLIQRRQQAMQQRRMMGGF